MFKSEQQLEQEAESKIGFLSDGMWITTYGQKFYSKRMAITAQMEVDEIEHSKNLSDLDSV